MDIINSICKDTFLAFLASQEQLDVYWPCYWITWRAANACMFLTSTAVTFHTTYPGQFPKYVVHRHHSLGCYLQEGASAV